MTTRYTKEQIQAILHDTKFEYHRVNLPYGLHTPGRDRTPTRDLIFPKSLEGKSVLDVGCALGYFCFEAETLGATKVVGVDFDDVRIKQAQVLKEILNSDVEFIHGDIFDLMLHDSFDYILLLNVVHHSVAPMHLIRELSKAAKEKLIIEFPTFADPKFRSIHRFCFDWFCNRLPLIGASSLKDQAIDQTFVFSPRAMKRILTDHFSCYSDVQMLGSPIKARCIAVCTK